MAKYRKKSRPVNAFRLGQKGCPTPDPVWFQTPHHNNVTEDGIYIMTSGGLVLARWGDWIVQEEDELCPYSPASFESSYELVNNALEN